MEHVRALLLRAILNDSKIAPQAQTYYNKPMKIQAQAPNRLRQTELIRTWVEETNLSPKNLIMPIFINESLEKHRSISSLPGINQWSLNDVLEEVKEIVALKIPAIILFGIPKSKDEKASEAYNPEGIIQNALRLIKSNYPDLIILADCCLCEYTDHGHCLIEENTLETLQKIAISYAKAGADLIAPSGMIDGMVAAIRTALDENNHQNTLIMSYSAKYASAFYGPFREAAGSSDNFTGDRKHHQMNPPQREEALREAQLDTEEGADFLMVKPAGPYLDIIRDIKNTTHLPVAAYQVSGEYAMLKSAAKEGIIDEKAAFEESLLAIKRAGASHIITYYAKDYLK